VPPPRHLPQLLAVGASLLLSGCGHVHFGPHVPAKIHTELAAENTSLRAELTGLRARAAEPPSYETLAGTVGDYEPEELASRLSTALRSYQLLQDENDRLKVLAEKLTTEQALLATKLASSDARATELSEQLTVSASTARLVETLRTQLRQTQDQLSAVILDYTQLRDRVALVAPPGAGSVQSLRTPAANITVPATVAPLEPVELKTPERTLHTVVEGETLSGIARRYYRNSQRWPEIFEANRNLLTDERSLRVGMELRIP
jgi:LysM repeat protein